jgi:PAS domain S-box-containing protein
MLNLFRRRVAVKIASGYVIIFLSILLASSFIIFRLFTHTRSLRELSNQTAIDARFAHEIIEQMMETSYLANLYLAGGMGRHLEDYSLSYGELESLLEEAGRKSTFAYSQYEFGSIRQKVHEYNDTFSSAVTLTSQINDYKNQILNEQTNTLVDQMNKLRSMNNIQSELSSYITFSEFRVSILALQLNIMNYLYSHDDKESVLAEDNFRLAQQSMAELLDSAKNEEVRLITEDIGLTLDTYYLGFQIIQNHIVQLNNLRISGLDLIVPRIIEQARGVDQKLKNDTQLQVLVLEGQLRNTLTFFTPFFLILLVISILSIRWTTSQITNPLSRINTTANEIARHDLRILISDLELLSQGNLAVGTGFISRPVDDVHDDEVGQVAEALNAIIEQLRSIEDMFYNMAEYLQGMSAIASSITHNQFDIPVHVRSDQDVLGNALLKLIDRLREANFQVQEQLIRLSTLRQIDTFISTNIDLAPTMKFITNQAVRLLGFTWGSIVLFDEKSGQIKITFVNDEERGDFHEWNVWCAQVLRRVEHPYYLNDIVHLHDQTLVRKLTDYGIGAWYGNVIHIKGQFKGVFQVFHPTPISEDDERIDFFSTLIGQIVIAIEHAELLQELEGKVEARTRELNRRAVQTQTAAEISHSATSTLHLDQLMRQSVGLIRDRFDMYYVGLFLVGERGESAWLRAATGDMGSQLLKEKFSLPLIATSMVGWTILHGKSRVAHNIFQDPLHYHNPLLPETRSEITLPLITRDQVIGAITVQSAQPSAFTLIEVTVLQTIADQLANAIANARLYQESQKEKLFFESIVRTSSVAVVILDMDGSILVWNPAAEKLFGWSAAEAIGKKLADLSVLFEQDQEESSFNSLQDEGKSIKKLTRRYRKDGIPVDVELSATLVQVEVGQAGILVLYHDITELQYSKKVAETATQAKSEFLANISHEIRTPMNAILGMANIVLGTTLSASQRDFVDTIRTSSEELISLLNDLLDFSRIEAKRLELEIRPFDLRECVESALDLVAVRAAEKNLDLAYLIHPAVPEWLNGDNSRLRQVLINLLNNAVKFTGNGEVVVEVKAKPKSEPNWHEFLFSVRDTGIGITPDQRNRLFQYFSQAESSITRKYGGSGLGLAISKQLVELMGGKIWVESSGIEGEGSIFSFTIQVEAVKDYPISSPTPDQRILQGARALVGMPATMSTDFLLQNLLYWGVQVNFKSELDVVWDILQDHKSFSYLILDTRLLEMDTEKPWEVKEAIFYFIEKVKAVSDNELLSRTIIITPKGWTSEYDIEGILTLERPVKPLALRQALQNIGKPALVKELTKPAIAPLMAEQWPLDLLVVEDDPLSQKVIRLLLSQLGYRPETVDNGFQAMEKLRSSTYDVIFMDVQMPGLDGVETTRQILENPEINRPFVIAITGNALPEDRASLLASGMDAYLPKPVQLSEIRQAILTVIERKESRFEKIADPGKTKDNDQSKINNEENRMVINSSILFDYFPQLSSNDKQKFNELIDLFAEETPNRIRDIKEAQKIMDYELARNAVHTLKGTSLTFGAMRLSNLAIQAEKEIQGGNLETIDDLVYHMELEFSQVLIELRRIGGLV